MKIQPVTDGRLSRPSSQSQLEVARQRQELAMRWLLLLTVITSVLLSSLATLIYGPPSLHFALVQGTWASMLGWLIRKLFAN